MLKVLSYYLRYIVLFFSGYMLSQTTILQQEVELLLEKSDQYYNVDNDSFYYYLQRAYPKAQKLQNDTLVARCYYDLSWYYSNILEEFEKSKEYALRYKEIAKRLHDERRKVRFYKRLGDIERKKGDNRKALSIYQEGILSAEKIGYKEIILDFNQRLYKLYFGERDSVQAYMHLKKYYEQSEKLDRVFALNDLSYYYLEFYNQDSAVYYNKEGIKLSNKLNLEHESLGFYINLGSVYLSGDQDKYNLAYKFLEKSETLLKKYPEDISNNFFLLNIWGEYHRKTKNYPKAIEYYQKALVLEKRSGVDDDSRAVTYKYMSNLYRDMNDYKNAYKYHVRFKALKDSLFSIEKSNEFKRIQTEYEVEKKDQEITLLTKEKEVESLQKKQLVFGTIALLIPSILGLLFYRNRLRNQKIIQVQEKELFHKEKQQLEQEKEMEHIKSILKGQDQERNRLAKEIHDGAGGQLAGIKLKLSHANSQLQNKKIEAIVKEVDDVFQELREISHDLSLNYIENKNLIELLEELKIKYETYQQFSIELVVFPEGFLQEVSGIMKHHIYRIIQELLYNTFKHAEATQVSILFTDYEDELDILFEDNGKGFDPQNITKGIGIQNIEERIKYLKGSWNIDSQINKGVNVHIEISKNRNKLM